MNTTEIFLKNEEIFEYKPDNEISTEGIIIYEVVRLINSKILFFEDHLNRFFNSLNLAGIEPPDTAGKIRTNLYKFINACKSENGNIKFFYCITENNEINFFAHYIPHRYPTEEEYQNGVNLTLYNAVRINPSIKEENKTLKNKIQDHIKKENAYETLLIHTNGYITEGSRSNFFLINNNCLFTAPLHDVLEGITAKQLISLCKQLNIKVEQKKVQVTDLPLFDSAFITGTSPKILPVKTIGEYNFNPQNKLLRYLINEFDTLINNYINLT